MISPFSNIKEVELRRLLKIRKMRKREFKRPYSWIWNKLDESWRRPRGKDNKVRLQIKGKPPLVKTGYRSPKRVRCLHPTGKEIVTVRKVEDLYNIDPLTQVAMIAGTIGVRKRLEILGFAKRFGIKVLNPGRAEARLELETEGIAEEEEEEEVVEEYEEDIEEEE